MLFCALPWRHPRRPPQGSNPHRTGRRRAPSDRAPHRSRVASIGSNHLELARTRKFSPKPTFPSLESDSERFEPTFPSSESDPSRFEPTFSSLERACRWFGEFSPLARVPPGGSLDFSLSRESLQVVRSTSRARSMPSRRFEPQRPPSRARQTGSMQLSPFAAPSESVRTKGERSPSDPEWFDPSQPPSGGLEPARTTEPPLAERLHRFDSAPPLRRGAGVVKTTWTPFERGLDGFNHPTGLSFVTKCYVSAPEPVMPLLRLVLGDAYTEAVRTAFGDDVPNTVDFVMDFWDQAARRVQAGESRRFGLITSNSIRQTQNRQVLTAHLDGEPPLRRGRGRRRADRDDGRRAGAAGAVTSIARHLEVVLGSEEGGEARGGRAGGRAHPRRSPARGGPDVRPTVESEPGRVVFRG